MALQPQINIVMEKVTGVLNAGSFKSVKFKHFVASDQAFSFMNIIKETPPD